ncbi:MAG: ABC transporter ATP-binding protein [Patescibacteria group bacterium]
MLKGINLEIKRGEFVALMGESGGGKSTLLNIIGCLHPLSRGKYFLEGRDIGVIREDYALAFVRNRKMGFVFQSFNLLSRMTALKNVALPAVYSGMSRIEREKRAAELLRNLGLGNRLDHRPPELSGGQQQRVAIARALMNDPEIILADEPTGALDSKSGEEIMEIFCNLKKRDKTVLMVTHTAEAAKYADRIVFLKDGKILSHDYKLQHK